MLGRMLQPVLWIMGVCVASLWSFNLSPSPKMQYTKPIEDTHRPVYRSSYFGFSVNLRHYSILIGAPMAQSTFESQKLINETGAVYKCNIKTHKCNPFSVDLKGNEDNFTNNVSRFETQLKDNQMFGFSMAGNGADEDSFITCAPSIHSAIMYKNEEEYWVRGACYVGSNSNNPNSFTRIQTSAKSNKEHERYSQEGFSVAVTPDSNSFLLGSPGMRSWQGNVRLYNIKKKTFHHFVDSEHTLNFSSYLGYAVTTAHLQQTKTHYIASAPTDNFRCGTVRILTAGENNKIFENVHTFYGKEIGAYFGFSILADDFDNDSIDEILISSPMHADEYTGNEIGTVFYFKTTRNVQFFEPQHLKGRPGFNGRFGTALAKLGDINADYCNDVAISAPYEGNGVVYIFLGSDKGINTKWQQILEAPANSALQPSWFGYTVSQGVDIDNNNFNDIAVGAPQAEKVYTFLSYPVIEIAQEMKFVSTLISTTSTYLDFDLCLQYHFKYSLKFPIKVNVDITTNVRFASIDNPQPIITIEKKAICKKIHIDFSSKINVFENFVISTTYDLTEKPENSTFCENCVMTDPRVGRTIKQTVLFDTECSSDKCTADLNLNATILTNVTNIIAGKNIKSVQVKYTISNTKEPAYGNELHVFISESVKYQSIPGNCHEINAITLVCDVNNYHVLRKDESDTILITIDVNSISVDQLIIEARVETKSIDEKTDNNQNNITIPFIYASKIENIVLTSDNLIKSKDLGVITHEIKIHNKGFSVARNITVSIDSPKTFQLENGTRLSIVENAIVTAKYNGFFLETISEKSSHSNSIIVKNEILDSMIDHTIFYDCKTNECQRKTFKVDRFLANIEIISINITYVMNISALDAIFNNTHNSFAFQSVISSELANATNQSSISFDPVNPFTVIKQTLDTSTPIWVYIVSGVAGLVILIVLVIILYLIGFFKRDEYKFDK